jgi:anti-sigma B factor antagonist
MHTSPDLRTQLRSALQEKATPLVVDLTQVAFIDSSGLATLIEALQATNKYGGRLRLCGLSSSVQNLFRLSNLTSIFDIRATSGTRCVAPVLLPARAPARRSPQSRRAS